MLAGYAAGTQHPITDFVFGPMGATLAMIIVFLCTRESISLRGVEYAAYGFGSLMLLSRIALVLLPPRPDVPLHFLIADFSAWIAPTFILAFVMLETRQAMVAGLLLYASMVSIAGAHVAMRGLDNISPLDFNAIFQTFITANAFQVGLLLVMALTREAFGKAETESDLMNRLAHTDELTGVPNRRHVVGACSKEVERLARHPRPFSVVLLDIDHFKRVNDGLGHAIGDAVLQQVAETMQATIRAADQLGRYGGEEFLVLAYDTNLEMAAALAERLRVAVEHAESPGLPSVTASFGVSAYREGDTLETLLARADTSLYAAKGAGRNCVVAESESAGGEEAP